MVYLVSEEDEIMPLRKKAEQSLSQIYRLAATNRCTYTIYATMVGDLMTERASAENHIFDKQFEFCPTRNKNQPIHILCHI